MQTFETLTYFNGMSAGIFFFATLICGLQLCFIIFGSVKKDNIILSQLVGAIMLLMSCSTICYIVYDTFIPNPTLLIAGNTIDYTIFCLSALAANVLYTGNRPSTRATIILSAPFIILATINIFIPAAREYLLDAVVLTLILQYAYYAIMLRQYEDSLDDLSRIRGVIALFAGWWVLHITFKMPAISIWYDAAMYTYMVSFVYLVFIKINKLGKSVSLETQKQIEKAEWKEICTSAGVSNPMKKELMRLLEEENIYLNPELTVIDVVKKLGTNTKYFSAMLHNDMHTTFCALINEYRIEKAKKLLQSTDDKIEIIGMSCGFNSRQSFCRVFFKITGKQPTDFRNAKQRIAACGK